MNGERVGENVLMAFLIEAHMVFRCLPRGKLVTV
jgi:hypothetical protein